MFTISPTMYCQFAFPNGNLKNMLNQYFNNFIIIIVIITTNFKEISEIYTKF